jgi:hypothetical protein
MITPPSDGPYYKPRLVLRGKCSSRREGRTIPILGVVAMPSSSKGLVA